MGYKKYADLTYSFSRLKMLATCERGYYYSYYEFGNGWRRDAPQRSKTAYKLKKLQAIEGLLGEAIHASAANIISDTGLSPKDFRRMTNKFIRENYRNSLSRKEEWLDNHKIFTMVQEIYYNGCVKMETQQKNIEKIELCSENFISSKSFSEIQSDSNILTIDELKDYCYNDITAYVKIDAIYQIRESGKYVIVDWKGGKGGVIDVK